ncbi:hypothetical protein ACEK07_39540 [Alcanivoracaceae bacterium MT1]
MRLKERIFGFVVVIILSSCSRDDVIVLGGIRSCFFGKLIEEDIVGAIGVGKVFRIAPDCLDDESQDELAPRPGKKKVPEGVNLRVCTSRFRSCGDKEDEKNIVYVSFFVPKGRFVADLIDLTRKHEKIIEEKEGLEIYGSRTGGVSIVPSDKNRLFRVKCWEEGFAPCEMIGVSSGGLQYSASLRFSSAKEDWSLLHDKINAFLMVGLSKE